MSDNYYIVEFRLPIQVNNADSPKQAQTKAAKEIEKRFGFLPSGWFSRVFEYDNETVGVKSEWFCSPGGGKFRKVDKNIKDTHENSNIEI